MNIERTRAQRENGGAAFETDAVDEDDGRESTPRKQFTSTTSHPKKKKNKTKTTPALSCTRSGRPYFCFVFFFYLFLIVFFFLLFSINLPQTSHDSLRFFPVTSSSLYRVLPSFFFVVLVLFFFFFCTVHNLLRRRNPSRRMAVLFQEEEPQDSIF